jgi:hypothetical protein
VFGKEGLSVILDDAASIKAALATMNPVAREATQLLVHRIAQEPTLLQEQDKLRAEALQSCTLSFLRAGNNLKDNREKFERFLDDHGANVLDLAVSVILFTLKDARWRQVKGVLGKVAAGVGIVGAAALGAFFG